MSEAHITYNLSLLEQSRSKWENSAALRAVYRHIFQAMAAECVPGSILEVGSGIGVADEVFPNLVTSDLVRTKYVERAVSAYEIPDENWANIVAMDVLHHLQRPFAFFASAAEALRPGGRIVLMEPAGTEWGERFYGRMHHEPCRPQDIEPPFDFPNDANGEYANMGMGVGLLERNREETEDRLAKLGLRIVNVHYRDLLAYPATGGFSKPAILPAFVLRGLMAIEGWLPQGLLRLWALRMIIVVEKTSPDVDVPAT
jgi:SAM-dependent methyltransferase